MEQFTNQIRFYHYISAVLLNQQADSLCLKCKAYSNTVLKMREELERIKTDYSEKINSLPDELSDLHRAAQERISSARIIENVTGQKTAGNCKMPKGVCFVKSSKLMIEKL